MIKAQAAAATNGVFVAVADRCRAERGVSWISGSVIVGPGGYPLAGPVLADRAAVLTAACDLPRARDKSLSGDNDLLADRRPELYTWAPDKRVAAATTHWAARFVANGTSYPDFQATMARIRRWDDWCREWGRTGQHYEELAETAEAAGRLVTAGEAWRRAALCWHWGKFVFTDHPEEQRAAHERTVACFRRGAGTLSPPAESVRVPYAGSTLAAYLRVPPARPQPVVIMIPGLDSVKEELQATAEHLLSRGLAVIAIDGPGQGEAEYELPIEPAYERVTTAVADYLKGRDDIDPDRLGVFGVSLGGYYAARSAAYEPRVRATVALAGPYRWDLDWDMLPAQTRTTFQHRSGAGSPAEARERAAAMTLEDAAARITRPLLVAYGGRDRLVPPYHAERLAREAPGAELLMYPDGSHGLTNHAFESRAAMADWLAARLYAGSGPLRGEQGDGRDLLLGQVLPADAGGRARPVPAAVDDALGRHDEVHRHVVAGQRDRPGRADLEFVHGGDADGVRPDQPRRGGQREFQVGEPAALAQPGAVLPGRDTAHHHQVDRGNLGQRDPAGGAGRAADRSRLAGRLAQVGGIQGEERLGPGQPRDGHVHGLAVLQRALAHRPLGGVRVGLHGAGRLPGG